MFGKEKNKTISGKITPSEPVTPATLLPESADISKGNTVVASGVRFEGNIRAAGMIYIHGEVHGNIESMNGMVKIMRNGLVEGNIIAREVVIDGTLIGQCHADVLDIFENGNITGAINYHSLAIKRGGIFSGQAETRPTPANNIIEITANSADESGPCLAQESLSGS